MTDTPHSPSGGMTDQDAPLKVGNVFNRADAVHTPPTWHDNKSEVEDLPAIEAMIRSLTDLPTYERCLEDDFLCSRIAHGKFKGHETCIILPDSRLQECRRAVGTLSNLEQQTRSLHQPPSLSLHAQSFLTHLVWCYSGDYHWPKLRLSKADATVMSQRFQRSIAALRREVTSPSFKQKIRNTNTLSERHSKNLRHWFNQAFRQAPDLLWVHLQLGYRDEPYVNIKQTLEDRRAFLYKRHHNPLFRHSLGYVSKLHYRLHKGLMHDMILLYDAQKVREDASLCHALAGRWEEVTDHRGMAWMEGPSINNDTLRINGVWSNRTPEDKRRLKALIHYLSRYDTYLRYELPSNTRTLVKSQIPGKKRAKGKKDA